MRQVLLYNGCVESACLLIVFQVSTLKNKQINPKDFSSTPPPTTLQICKNKREMSTPQPYNLSLGMFIEMAEHL